MANNVPANITIEDAQIIWPNFSGKEGPFNAEGDRNFSVLIPDGKLVQQLVKDGWNVKYTKPREEGDQPEAYLPVAVKYSKRPPRIVMIATNGKTNITETMCEILDQVQIRTADIIINASLWEVGGKSGIKAYLKTMYVTIEEDELELKYADVGDSNG